MSADLDLRRRGERQFDLRVLIDISRKSLPRLDFDIVAALEQTKRTADWAWQSYDYDLAFELRSAIPEPASWALMITGFGLTGTALRRRKRQIAGTVRIAI